MSNLNTLNRRLERLENGKRKPAHNIKISYKFNKWVVNKDGAEFDTLRDACAHVKKHYSTNNVQIDQTEYIMDKTDVPTLRKMVAIADKAVNHHIPYEEQGEDDIFLVFTKPCDQLKEVEKSYSTMHFDIVVDDEKIG